jgi:hypothetical protein
MKLDEGSTKASVEDSKRVVAICTLYAQCPARMCSETALALSKKR